VAAADQIHQIQGLLHRDKGCLVLAEVFIYLVIEINGIGAVQRNDLLLPSGGDGGADGCAF